MTTHHNGGRASSPRGGRAWEEVEHRAYESVGLQRQVFWQTGGERRQQRDTALPDGSNPPFDSLSVLKRGGRGEGVTQLSKRDGECE